MSDYDHHATIKAALDALAVADISTAEHHARKATKHNPDSAQAWSLLGLCLDGDAGLDALTTAVQTDPSDPRWFMNLGKGLQSRGLLKHAQKAYSMAAECSQGHPDAMEAWADSLFALERYSDAAQVYGRVLQSRQTPQLWVKAGDALFGAEDFKSAILAYERASSSDDRPVSVTLKMAKAYIATEAWDNARKCVDAVQPDTPDAPDVRRLRDILSNQVKP